jgi:hypothetical protein
VATLTILRRRPTATTAVTTTTTTVTTTTTTVPITTITTVAIARWPTATTTFAFATLVVVVVVVLWRPLDVELSCALQAVRADTHELRKGILELGEPHCVAASEVADGTERRVILNTIIGDIATATTDAVAGVRVDEECNVGVEHEPIAVEPHLENVEKVRIRENKGEEEGGENKMGERQEKTDNQTWL